MFSSKSVLIIFGQVVLKYCCIFDIATNKKQVYISKAQKPDLKCRFIAFAKVSKDHSAQNDAAVKLLTVLGSLHSLISVS